MFICRYIISCWAIHLLGDKLRAQFVDTMNKIQEAYFCFTWGPVHSDILGYVGAIILSSARNCHALLEST